MVSVYLILLSLAAQSLTRWKADLEGVLDTLPLFPEADKLLLLPELVVPSELVM